MKVNRKKNLKIEPPEIGIGSILKIEVWIFNVVWCLKAADGMTNSVGHEQTAS